MLYEPEDLPLDYDEDYEPEENRPVSILDLAEYRGLHKAPDGSSTAEDFAAVGLAIFGGCVSCHASLAAYNAYPSKSGYWKCDECIGPDGWFDVEEANRAIFPPEPPKGYGSSANAGVPT